MCVLGACRRICAERLPYAWLRERHVDLLLCSELHANGGVARLFAERAGCSGSAIAGTWVSHAEHKGESDLVGRFDATPPVVGLIENTIAANFLSRW